MGDAPRICLRVSRQRESADEWVLVLASQGFSAGVERVPEGFALVVPNDQAEGSVAALAAWEAENPPAPAQTLERRIGPVHVRSALAISAALLLFFIVTGPRNPRVSWFECGSADSTRILAGDLWRAVTALTLHADPGHVLANAAAGALFLSAVFAALGPGLGAALVLVAGVGGNLLNAVFQSHVHVSVGASTSVFGAVGLLAGLGVVRSRRGGARGRRAWTPVAAGLALLAMLGTGQRADVWAHLYGLLVGSVLGLVVAFALPRPPGLRAQLTLGAAALAGILYAWGLALEPGLCRLP